MTKTNKTGKHHNLQRSARQAPHNKAMRPIRIRRARDNNLKAALQSCGKAFASNLEAYYSANPNPGKRH